MILLLAALAQPVLPQIPSAETLRKYPPIVVAPPAPPAPPRPLPSFDLLSASGRDLVKAQDEKVSARETADRAFKVDQMTRWVGAIEAERFDAQRVAKAGAAVDAALGRQGVFAGWADVLARLSPDDRKVLVPHLNSSSGRVFYRVPSPPMIKLPSATPEAQRTPLNQGMATLFMRMGDESSEREKRRREIDRVRAEAAEIIRRKPFDPAAAKKALRRAQELRSANENLTTDATINTIATLPADQRDAVIDALWKDPRIVPVPPAPRMVPVPPAPRPK